MANEEQNSNLSQILHRSEEAFHTLTKSLHEGIIVLSSQGEVLSISPKARELLGVKKNIIMTESFLDLGVRIWSEEGEALSIEDFKLWTKVEQKAELIFLLIDQEQKRRWISYHFAPIESFDATENQYLLSFVDITETHHLIQAQKERERLLRALSESSSELIKQGNLKANVQKSLEILGRALRITHIYIIDLNQNRSLSLDGISWQLEDQKLEVNHSDLSLSMLNNDGFLASMKNGELTVYKRENEDELLKKLMTERNIEHLLYMPIIVNEMLYAILAIEERKIQRVWSKSILSSIESWISTMQMTLQKDLINLKLQEKIKESESLIIKADESNRAKTQFLAMMSHELRTPLNGIIGMTGLLLGSNMNEEQAHFARTARLSGQLMLALINDILDFSKIEVGKIEFENLAFDIVKLMHDVKEMMSDRAKEKNLIFEMKITGDPSSCLGDETKIKQVLLNLLSNAIKFTENGTIKFELDAKHSAKTINLSFRVSDTGIGIEKNKIPLLFQKFSQTDSSISRKYGGTGLGLAISQALVQGMGGEISVESYANQGSTFSFELELERFTGELPASSHEEQEVNLPEGMKILIAEDNIINQQVIEAMCKKINVKTEIVANGQEAINILAKIPFDLILMDVQMPEMDGLEATRRIREMGNTIPIIGLSANATLEDKEASFNAGMNGFVTKPIDLKKLKESLIKFIPENPVTKSPDALEIFDRAMFWERMMGDKSLAQSIVNAYLIDTAKSLAIIEKAIEASDFDKVSQEAHKIKGASAILAALEMKSFFAGLEKISKEKNNEEVKIHGQKMYGIFGNIKKVFDELVMKELIL